MQSKLVRIDSLRSDPKNARKHNEKNISVIAESLKRFGQRKPIVISGDIVIAGNGTLQAAQYLGWKEITVVETPKDWNEETIRAYALADNRSAELAEWDLERLSEQLFELEETLNIEDLGFNLPKLDIEEESIGEFKSYDETMATSHACPKCGYEWNGSSK